MAYITSTIHCSDQWRWKCPWRCIVPKVLQIHHGRATSHAQTTPECQRASSTANYDKISVTVGYLANASKIKWSDSSAKLTSITGSGRSWLKTEALRTKLENAEESGKAAAAEKHQKSTRQLEPLIDSTHLCLSCLQECRSRVCLVRACHGPSTSSQWSLQVKKLLSTSPSPSSQCICITCVTNERDENIQNNFKIKPSVPALF